MRLRIDRGEKHACRLYDLHGLGAEGRRRFSLPSLLQRFPTRLCSLSRIEIRTYNPHFVLSSYSSSRYPSSHRIEAMTRPSPAACPTNKTRRVSPRLPVHWVLTNNCAADRSDHPWQHTPDNEIATFFICDSVVLQGRFPTVQQL